VKELYSIGPEGFDPGDMDGWVRIKQETNTHSHAIRARLEEASIHHHAFFRLSWESRQLVEGNDNDSKIERAFID
jgi:hypothetical protein